VATFSLTHSWLSTRSSWPVSLLVGWGVYFALTVVFERITVPLVISFVGVMGSFAMILYLLPADQHVGIIKNPPRWEILLRMLVITTFVVGLTSIAALVGPQLSGLLTTFPIYASILGAFTHHFQGAAAARRLLRGVVAGSYTFAIFFLIIAGMIERWGIAVAFGLAIAAALATHGAILLLLRRK
jgi:hypothetical protein